MELLGNILVKPYIPKSKFDVFDIFSFFGCFLKLGVQSWHKRSSARSHFNVRKYMNFGVEKFENIQSLFPYLMGDTTMRFWLAFFFV